MSYTVMKNDVSKALRLALFSNWVCCLALRKTKKQLKEQQDSIFRQLSGVK
jgi:hypothetical protein